MEDLFKKFIYTGIGLMSITTERLQKNIDELVSKKKLSTEEGRKIVDDVMQKTEVKRGELEKQLKKISDELTGKFNFAKTKELEALEKRIEVLELKLGKAKTKSGTVQKVAPASEKAPQKNKKTGPVKKEPTNTSLSK